MEQDDSKKDLAMIMARLSELIGADNQQKTVSDSRDFTVNKEPENVNALQSELSDDIDENYPELTEIAGLDYDSVNDADSLVLNKLMTKLKPAIDAAVNRAITRILLDAKQPLKQQLELEIRQQLLKLL